MAQKAMEEREHKGHSGDRQKIHQELDSFAAPEYRSAAY